MLGLADEAWQDESTRWAGAPTKAFPVQGPKSVGRSAGLRRALIGGGFDVVHSHGIWMHPSADVGAWALSGKAYVVAPHGMLDSWALSTSRVKKRIARLLYEDRHLRGAACFQALCTPEAEAVRNFGLTQPICTIPNGVDIPGDAPSVPAPWASRFAKESRVLLFLGRLHPKKNIAAMIQALSAIKRADGLGDWRLAVAGWDQDGHKEELAGAVAENGMDAEVALLGPLYGAEKDAALRNADAFVLPSLSEGMPMAVLEAWAYGLPVAMTVACNIPRGFAAGAAVEIEGTPEAMTEDLTSFLKLPAEALIEMGAHGRRLAAEEFSWSAVAARLQDVYGWILEGRPEPNCVTRSAV